MITIILSVFTCILLFTSCYSVRIVSTQGTPNPYPMSERDDFYRDKMVIEIDTVIKAGTLTNEIGFKVSGNHCKSGKIHSVEYANTFGGALLYLFSFGNKRKVKIKYVCMKIEN